MKRLRILLCALMAVFALAGCTQSGTPKDGVVKEPIEVTLNLAFGEMTGAYTGELKDGLPNGKGKFVSSNLDQKTWYYEGDFKEGHFDGEGKTVFEETGQTMEGAYVMDIWHPNTVQYYGLIETLPDSSFTVSEKAKALFAEKEELFPAESAEALSGYVDNEMKIEAIYTTPENFGDKIKHLEDVQLLKKSAFAITENPENLQKLRCTYLKVKDADGQVYDVFYRGTLDDIQVSTDENVQNIIGSMYVLPIGWQQTSDGVAVAAAGCFVEK